MVLTWVDIIQHPVVSGFIKGDVWHALGIAGLSLYGIFRISDWYFYRARRYLREFERMNKEVKEHGITEKSD